MIIEAFIAKVVLSKFFGAVAAKTAAGVVGKVALAQTVYQVGDAINDAVNASAAVPIDVQGNGPRDIQGNPSPSDIHGNQPRDIHGNQPRNVLG